MLLFKNGRRLHLPIIIVLSSLVGKTQDTLAVGSLLPDLTIPIILPSGDVIPFDKFRKKMILLDFWAHNCIGCVQQFTHLDSLQKEFSADMAIILVNKESTDSNERFFKRFPKIKKPSVFMISGDSLLHQLLPHDFAPFHVWIDENRRVVYKTDGYSATKENVEKFLRNDRFAANQVSLSKNYISTLFSESYLSALKEFSYLSQCASQYRLSSINRPDAASLTFNCLSAVELYQYAYSEGMPLYNQPGRTVLKLKNPEKYSRPPLYKGYASWQSTYAYNYQLLVPATKRYQLYTLFQQDLNRYFGLRANVDTLDVMCLALIRTSNNDKLSTKHTIAINRFEQSNERSEKIAPLRYMQNIAFAKFSNRLKGYVENAYGSPFVDETGLSQAIDISISGEVLDDMDFQKLKTALRQYDLDIVERHYPLPVLVLRDE